MFKSLNSRFLLIAALTLGVLAACSDSDEKSEAAAAIASAGELLSYVPADSPYVFASLSPLPEDVMDKLEPKIDRILQSYEVVLQEIAATAAAEVAKEGGDEAEAEKAVAVLGELSSLLSMEGLRGAGFEKESRAVLYGNGILPVLRVELSDGALFEAALQRIEESAGEKMEVASIAGNSVRYMNAEELKVLVAILDKQLVVSLAPGEFSDEQLASLLGFTPPTSGIADSGILQDIAGKYGYDDYMIGYIDFEHIVATFTGSATGLDADMIAMFGDHDDTSDVCRAEIRSVAGIAPRMVMGYTDVNTERFESQMVVELRDDIAAGLKTWPAAVPGLGTDPGGLMSFGFSMDVMAVREFYEAQLDAIEADPFECEEFAEIQAGVAQGRTMLQQPVPPMVYDFRGLFGVVQDVEGLDMRTQAPTDVGRRTVPVCHEQCTRPDCDGYDDESRTGWFESAAGRETRIAGFAAGANAGRRRLRGNE